MTTPAQQPAASGWIPWEGGECPVDPEARVEVRSRDGTREIGKCDPGFFDWRHDPKHPYDADIIAYRVVPK